MTSKTWSIWRTFPDPRSHGELVAPIGPGFYELRHRSTGELILHGSAAHTAQRITSLLPYPYGRGLNDSLKKQNYVFQHLSDVEYRTVPFSSLPEARIFEVNRSAEAHYLIRGWPRLPNSKTPPG